MPLNIFVLAKQVIDPEMPRSAFQVDRENRRVVSPSTLPPVVNGFDENAVEASLRIKDSQAAVITVISMGTELRPGRDEETPLHGRRQPGASPRRRFRQHGGPASSWPVF